MKGAIHYVVKAKLIRLVKGNEIDFLEFEEKFENEYPIVARENAFRHYQNFIDVLLEGKNKKYSSDKQARVELNSFIDPGTSTKVKIGEKEIEFSDSFGNGIGVFMVIDQPIKDKIFDDKVGEEFLIHGIGRISFSDDPQSLMDALNHEFLYYEQLNYDTKNYKQNIDFYEYDIAETETNKILKTPFDWTGYDRPQEDDETEEIEESPVAEKETLSFEQLIKNGESNQVEFKPTLLYNFSSGKAGISVKGIIAKAICAFLNSRGGFLFIGLTDKGEIQGLEYDYRLANGKSPKDFFQLEFDQMLSHFLSFSVKSNVVGQFFELEGKEIFVVTVSPSKHRPVFLNGHKGKEFYVRGEASSQPLTDIEKIVNYCIDRWAN
ncbi:ATP-binding protein [Marivirga tractuosa]|uniref:AlbA family DNA-binding domain-containing protein n=1 Tax=Marivirga tractuosa TaxID=1006 RepID=UPI0035D095AE